MESSKPVEDSKVRAGTVMGMPTGATSSEKEDWHTRRSRQELVHHGQMRFVDLEGTGDGVEAQRRAGSGRLKHLVRVARCGGRRHADGTRGRRDA